MTMAQEPDSAIVQWRHAPPEDWRYCPLCREPLVDQPWDGKMRRFCSQCGFVYWERPVPAVAALIVERHPEGPRVLLVRRRYPPQQGEWTLPGGGVEAGESVQAAMVREAVEETGLAIHVDREIGTWSTSTGQTIITFFTAHAVSGQVVAGTDALEASWFPLHRLPALAFSTHQDAVDRYREDELR